MHVNAPPPDPADGTRFDDLSPQQMVEINRLCDSFEQGWDGERTKCLEQFLSSVPDGLRAAALPELVAIDLECRARRGLSTDAKIYLQRFPDLSPSWLDHQIGLVAGLDSPHQEPELPIPDSVGDYRLHQELGRGGMGRVFKGVHRLMGRVVAIKVLHPSINRQNAAQRRFQREVRAVASLSHPNIVAAFDAREDNGILYLVSEFVDGTDLARAVRRKGPLKPRTAVNYVLQAAQGLKYAHDQGLVHRDIKPGNLLVDRKGVVKILDLGLARWRMTDDSTEREASLTRTDHIIGTVTYMSPEQARAPQDVDGRSDIYSLGCTLYFLLTGKPPFSGTGPVDTLLAHANDPIPTVFSPSRSEPVPPELEKLVLQMLAKNPNDRPADMRTLIAELKAVQERLKDPGSSSPASLYNNAALESPLFPPIALPAAPKSEERMLQRKTLSLSGRGNRKLVPWVGTGVVLSVVAAGWLMTGPLTRSGKTGSAANEELPGQSTVTAVEPQIAGSGVRFNGLSDYLQLEGFNVPFNGPAMIEVLVTAEEHRGPSNLVTWSGTQLIALFRSSDPVWGIAIYEGERSLLVTTTSPLPVGRESLVAGSWDGRQLRLFVNGNEVPVRPTEYPLRPGPTALFVGGIPADSLPPYQGTRFFAGSIRAVRVSQGELPAPARNLKELLVASDSTVALLAIDDAAPDRLRDLSSNQWRLRMFDVR